MTSEAVAGFGCIDDPGSIDDDEASLSHQPPVLRAPIETEVDVEGTYDQPQPAGSQAIQILWPEDGASVHAPFIVRVALSSHDFDHVALLIDNTLLVPPGESGVEARRLSPGWFRIKSLPPGTYALRAVLTNSADLDEDSATITVVDREVPQGPSPALDEGTAIGGCSTRGGAGLGFGVLAAAVLCKRRRRTD